MTKFDIAKEVNVSEDIFETALALMVRELPHYSGILADKEIMIVDIKDTDAYNSEAPIAALAGRTQSSLLQWAGPKLTIAIGIVFNVYDRQEQIEILAHELAHIAQIVTKRFEVKIDVEKKEIYKYWEGECLKVITEKDNKNAKAIRKSLEEELKLPWELEAQIIHNPASTSFGTSMKVAWCQIKHAFKAEYNKARMGGISLRFPSRNFVMEINEK